MQKSELVVKHNSLIRSRYDYTLAELRLIITIASMIEAQDEDFREYVVPAIEYAELMGADKDNTYKAVKKLGEMLLSKPLHIPTVDGFAICNWFSWYEYKKGMIHCSFDPRLKPYMLQLKEQFTKYRLENILRFKSVYSIRMYELAKSWEGSGEFTISIDELKEVVGAAGKYKAYYDLKRYVIEQSLKEISKLSDIELSYKEKRRGRKVTDLIFTIKKKKDDYLSSRKSFIDYIRIAYEPDGNRNIYPTIIKTENGELRIDKEGKLYLFKGAGVMPETLDHKQANEYWDWLYKGVKSGKLKLIDPPKA